MKFHFGSSVSCKCNIYFGWSLEIQVIYMKKGYGSLYGLKMLEMMFGDVMQILYIDQISWNFSSFRTHFGGSFQMENKIGKNIHVWGVVEM